ncbi:hypothetical protein P3X46_000801 [Hevea brasiliensis]|uniref:CCHC-type domain-containing protein n=1 Tax=Hevea brasiliensis TaxID=3981 RepID=A0ABQ9NDM3_HEVBR|nr:hypothetical protein P3X46_000801 [Hevea brasiliensis]
MKNTLADLWRPGRGMFVKEIEKGLFLFRFFHIVDMNRVWDGGPWSFNNHLLILHRMAEEEVPGGVPLYYAEFRVRVYDLPSDLITQVMAKHIGDYVGRKYMRIRVKIDVRKPLKRWKKLQKPDGSQMVFHFKYERLPIFCFLCGRLGHNDRYCEQLFIAGEGVVDRPWRA